MTDRRPRTGTALVLAATLVSLVAGLGARPPKGDDLGDLGEWVGTDGHVEVVAGGEPTILTTARGPGGVLALDGDPALFPVFNRAGALTGAWLLESARTGLTERLTLASSTPDGLAEAGVVEGGGLRAYAPAAISWPHRAAAGHTWLSEGLVQQAGTEVPFRREGRLEPSPLGPECLRAVVAESRGAQSVTTEQTRCRRRGLVTVDGRPGAAVAPRSSGIAAPDPGPASAPHAPAQWPHPWSPTPRQPHNGAMPYTLQLGEAPVAVHSGVAAINSFSRTVALVVPNSGEWRVLWRRRPGGTPTTLLATQEQLVVATSQRELVSYDVVGRWLWTAPLGDVANVRPVTAWPGRVATVTLDGTLSVHDLATGQLHWRRTVPAGTGIAPIAAAGLVVAIGDREVVAFDADGGRVWDAQAPARVRAAAYAGGALVVSTQEGHLLALDARGRTQWIIRRSQACRELHVNAAGLVCADDERATAYDPATGAVRWQHAQSSSGSGSDGTDVLLAGGPEVVRLAPDGGVRGRWPERKRVGHGVWVVTVRGGALVTDAGADFTVWDAP